MNICFYPHFICIVEVKNFLCDKGLCESLHRVNIIFEVENQMMKFLSLLAGELLLDHIRMMRDGDLVDLNDLFDVS